VKQNKPPDEYVVMGRVIAPYGVRGWIRVRPLTEAPAGLLDYKHWWLGQDEARRCCRLIDGRIHQDGLVACIEGVANREVAAQMRGWPIAVTRAELPLAPPGQYYWSDLVGLAVVNRGGEALGRVAEIFATGANDVLVVRGERERLIPFIAPVLVSVELENARLVVDWGMDY
jgi:16S rRNA processing protein RimM